MNFVCNKKYYMGPKSGIQILLYAANRYLLNGKRRVQIVE